MPDMSPILSWKAPTHEYTERSPDWFWAVGLIGVAGAVISVLFGNYLLALIIGLAAVCMAILALRPPRLCEITLTSQGIRVDHAFYPQRSLKSFWIDEVSRPVPQLIVATDSWLNPVLVLPLEEHVAPETVRTEMLKLLPEREQYESMFSHLADLMGL
jgi:hypothetical protein